MSKSNKSKHSKLTVQQRCLGAINKLESKIRGVRKKVHDGHYGMGNSFDYEQFASDMDDLAEVEVEVEWMGDHA